MKREQRRLLLARRQALLAEVRQHAAMRSLADALAEESRSATLAQRSRDLVYSYARRERATDGAGLLQRGQFSAALGSLAQDAEKARADASEQSAWQAEALGQAQTRARRHSQRLEKADIEFRAARDGREAPLSTPPPARGLARNMQSDARTASIPLETARKRTSK